MKSCMMPSHNQNARSPMICLFAVAASAFIPALQVNAAETDGKAGSYTQRVKECLDLLMTHGTDTYGEVHTPMLVSILDVESRTCPQKPEALDEKFRVTRHERRSPGGSNLLTDQPTLKAMYALSDISGNQGYATFADRYAGHVMEHLVDKQGFFWWGWHRHYDVFTDTMEGHNPNRAKWGEMVLPHEIHAMNGIEWDRLWAVNKDAVTRQIEAIWEWHVIDKETGEINRHGDGMKGCDFTMSGGSFIEAFVFMHSQTKDAQWLDRAKLIADYYWERRDYLLYALLQLDQILADPQSAVDSKSILIGADRRKMALDNW